VSTPTTVDLAQRYGTAPTHRRRLVTAGVVLLALVAVAWLAWVIAFHGRPLVRSDLVSFDVRGEHAAAATFTVVRRSEDVEASCLLRATAADHSIVGELNFTVDAGSPETSTLTREVRTERAATSVALLGCVAEGQNQRR
jgi:hypothetical protein